MIFIVQDVRNDITGDKRGTLILTMSIKPTLFFLLLIALTLRSSSRRRLAWCGLRSRQLNINLYAKADNVKRKIGIPVTFFQGTRQKDGGYKVNPDSGLERAI
jgi:hypothetical protein